MLRILLITLSMFFVVEKTNAQQTLQDSVRFLYEEYYSKFELTNKSDSIQLDSLGSLSGRIQEIDEGIKGQLQLINSNLRGINSLTTKDIISDSIQVNRLISKINKTSSYIFNLDVSINALNLTSKLTSYLQKAGGLNNATNSELGFSLEDQLQEILGETVLKKEKVNKIKKSKFLAIVNDIVKNPIVASLSSVIPVVSSIESIVGLFTNASLKGDDINVSDIVELKSSLKAYIRHYERLDSIGRVFNSDIRSLNLRTEGLSNLAKSYTIERLSSIDPNWRHGINSDTVSLSYVVEIFYYPERIEGITTNILDGPNAGKWGIILTDRKVFYPTYAVNQARFFYNEVKTLKDEYINVFNVYQNNLESVLNESKRETNGVIEPAEVINDLRDLKASALGVFETSMRLITLQRTFDGLKTYE